MKSIRSIRLSLFFIVTLLLAARPQSAGLADPPTPARQETLQVRYTAYTWWLLAWEDSELLCTVTVDHQGLPTLAEIGQDCDEDTFDSWVETGACEVIETDPSACPGLYLHFQGSQTELRTVIVDLPTPTVHVSLGGCTPSEDDGFCDGLPKLILTGLEPLPNERIVRIRGSLAGLPFTCPSSVCELHLRATAQLGSEVVFWGESSYGDSTALFTAQVRVLPAGNGPSLEDGSFVHVLSSQWRGDPPASCSLVWDAFPPAGGLPAWLRTPVTVQGLASNEPYALLAGRLISNGVADASSCSDGGLLPSGAASACGLDRSRRVVDDWQDRFDQLILDAAHSKDVPAQLMKNLFLRESQMWPGIYSELEEGGFGQLTPNGADSTLLWNEEFFDRFCPLVLNSETCASGYALMEEEYQELLRGALFIEANASCDSCPIGIDLTRVDYSIEVFAEALLANCEQVGRMITNTTGEAPGKLVGFEDLWRLTVANYNAGPGCVGDALELAFNGQDPLSWERISAEFDEVCSSAIDYVEGISVDQQEQEGLAEG